MPTINQLVRKGRHSKRKKMKSIALHLSCSSFSSRLRSRKPPTESQTRTAASIRSGPLSPPKRTTSGLLTLWSAKCSERRFGSFGRTSRKIN